MSRAGESIHGNLLREACLGVADLYGKRSLLTLPGVLARLGDPSQQTVAFTALQAHQAHAWHAFLVQLAAMVCHRADCAISDVRCREEEWWRERLIEIGGGEEAWCLVVDDLGKPGFLQTPVPEGNLTAFGKPKFNATEYDALNLSRNHDVKMMRPAPAIHYWVYSLIAFQTINGYTKAGPQGSYYSPFRQNAGTGNRFAVGFADPSELGAWFRRDALALAARRTDTTAAGGFAPENGQALLWLLPWDGGKGSAMAHAKLDPWCIEICRRLRLSVEGGLWLARQAPSEAERTTIAKAKTSGTQKWVLQSGYGDPWMACDRANNKALTPSEQGFTAKKVIEYLLSSDTLPPPAQTLLPEDLGSDLHWYGRTLVRGQGKTNGWHERAIPVPAAIRKSWRETPEARAKCAARAKNQLGDLDSLREHVLRPALLGTAKDPNNSKKMKHEMLLAGGREAGGWLTLFDDAADAAFFSHLWEYLGQDPDEARREWRKIIVGMARKVLASAQAAVPDGLRRWRALARSQQRFEAGLYNKPEKSDSFRSPLNTENTVHPNGRNP